MKCFFSILALGCLGACVSYEHYTDPVAARRAAGVVLGRPRGRLNQHLKLEKRKNQIQTMLNSGISRRKIAAHLNVSRNTLALFIHRMIG